MILWMILTVMCSAAAVLVAAPFLRRLDVCPSADDLTVYRDQLKEIDREIETGLMSADEAAGARIEISRRILSADSNSSAPARRFSEIEYNAAAIAIAGIVVLGSVGLYAAMGNPDIPAATPGISGEADENASQPSSGDGGDLNPATTTQTGSGATSTRGLASVDEMIARLETRLQTKPDDERGWQMLGWSYLGTGRFADAAKAYAKASALAPGDATLKTAQGEAIVRGAADTVSPEAMALFDSALKIDPKEPRARYFVGLAKEQSGKASEALQDWVALLKEFAPSEPWWADLRRRAAELAASASLDSTGIPAAPATESPPAAAPSTSDRGPTPGDIQRGDAMAPGDRDTMIRGMVERLAERLRTNPHDREGWLKLIRSYGVLGDQDKAKASLAEGLKALSDTPADQKALELDAAALGIKN